MDNAAKFAELEREIRRIDIDADTIAVSYHLRKFAELFQSHVVEDEMLSDLFTYLNRVALTESKFAINMAAIFASRQLDDLVIKETKLRNAMLTILQQNFQGIDELKREGVGKFYNSVTLLGEYYNRKKFVNGKRILILGQSLLLLLTTELEKEIKKCEENTGHTIDPEFAKIILSQVTLNGGEAKVEHKQEIEDLNYSIRKCLINVSGLPSRTKAYLLMSLDLFYMNFNLSSKLLENLYGKYLFGPDENTSAKQPEDGNKSEKKEDSSVLDKPATNSGASGSGAKNASKKPTDKTDAAKNQPARAALSKPPRKKEDKPDAVPASVTAKAPNTPPKKPPQNVTRRPPLNHTSPKKDQRPKAPPPQKTPPQAQKTPPNRRTPPEKFKPITPDRMPSKVQNGNSKPANKTPENPSVLKQNCKASSKSSTSPASNNANSPGSINLKHQQQLPVATNNHEDNVENLAWDDLTLEDESPQKTNPHTTSFLSFLAQK